MNKIDHSYKVFDLNIISRNLELPELLPNEKNVYDVEIIKCSRKLIQDQSYYQKNIIIS